MSLAGKAVLITGGSRGLGRALTERFVSEGANVALCGRDEAAVRAAAVELAEVRRSRGQLIAAHAADVSRPEDVERLVRSVTIDFGGLDVLVSNAGVYGPIGLTEEVSWDEWRQAVEINLFGAVLVCRAVVPFMRQRGRGKIIVLSGGGATQALPRFSAYAVSKAGLVRFVENLAAELAGAGIDVNAVAPGALNTRLLDQVLAAGPERAGKDFYARAIKQRDEGGTPLLVGVELVAFLASEASDGITGRLIAAVWDDWRRLPEIRDKLRESDVYTLRRIVPEDRGWPA